MKARQRWRVDVLIGADEDRTYAEATLETELGDRLIGVGHARRSPHDADVPEIGDEIAVARALRDLGSRLLDTAAADIEGITAEDVHLTR